MVNGQSHTYGDSYSYDDVGNILSKPDYATGYTYGSSSRGVGNAGPHAVSTVTESGVTTAAFQYDLNGNMTSGDGRTVIFDNLDRAVTVTMSGVTTQFRYAPDGQRYVQYTSGVGRSPYPKAVFYVDKSYERIDWSSASTEEKTYIGSSVMVYKQTSTRDVRYLHLDRLGSLDATTSSTGTELSDDSHGFDAFGLPRARDWTWSGAKLHPDTDYQKTTERGFTGQEHLDDLYLIHMNGRIYDYRLGRFLSVDPIISNPANSQSINPYSYILNNPLSGVDPTGYEPQKAQDPQGHDTASLVESDGQFQNVEVVNVNDPKSFNDHKTEDQKLAGQSDRNNAGPLDQTNNIASNDRTSSAGDVGRRLDGLAAKVDKALLGDERPLISPLKAAGDALRMLGDAFKLGEGIAAAKYDPTLSGWQRALSVLGDIARATIVLGPWMRELGSIAQGAREADFAAHLAMRAELGLSRTEGTLARLAIGGDEYWGINAHGQSIAPLRVNAISATHAEADAFAQALRAGAKGGSAVLTVDRALCPACGTFGAVRSMARQLGLDSLQIVTPHGTTILTQGGGGL